MAKQVSDGAEIPVISESAPRLVIALGRGKTGKSVMLRWIAETAKRDRRLRIIDADPNNQSLSQMVQGAECPPAIDGEDRRIWIEQQIEAMMEAASDPATRHDMLLDLGGGDLLLKQLGGELQIAEVLEASGIDVVALHMLGPDPDDTAFLADVEERGLFCPKRTAIVLNAGLVPQGRSAEAAFGNVLATAAVQRMLSSKRAARLVVMPGLGCMQQVEAAELPTFRSALEDTGRKKIGPLNAQRVRLWLDMHMPAVRQTLQGWIP